MAGEQRPFLGRQTVRNGTLTRHQLLRDYTAIHHNVYLPTNAEISALTRARAAWLWSAGAATLTGHSAAAVFGTKWLDPNRPAELSRINRHCPPGIVAHSYTIQNDETCVVDGIRVTAPHRTAFDIGRTQSLNTAVVLLDALAQATDFKVADVVALADGKPGFRGIRQLRRALTLVDGGAESPPETRLRLLLVGVGLPPPETQIPFYDEFGMVRIRVDMGWRAWKVAVEYDGVQHWADRRQRSWDIDRIAILESLGWAVVRVSAELLSRPDVVIERVTVKLRSAGCPI